MLSGGIDVMVEVPPDSLAQFQDNDDFKVYEQAGPHVWFLILNTKEGPFTDKRVRQAANYAINKKALVDNILQGTAEVAAGPTPPAFAWAYDDKPRALSLRSGQGQGAAQGGRLRRRGGHLLRHRRRLGHARSGRHGHGHPGRSRGGRHEGQDRDLRVEHLPRQGEPGPRRQGRHGRDGVDDQRSRHAALPGAAHDALPDKGGFNSGYYSNPKVDELLEKARTSTDQAERAKLYKQMQEIVHDDAPWVFVANWKQNAVTAATRRELQAAAVLLPDASEGREAAVDRQRLPPAARGAAGDALPARGRAMAAYIAKRLLAADPGPARADHHRLPDHGDDPGRPGHRHPRLATPRRKTSPSSTASSASTSRCRSNIFIWLGNLSCTAISAAPTASTARSSTRCWSASPPR